MNFKAVYILIVTLGILIGQDSKPTVAILDFEGQGVLPSEVQTLTERMRTESVANSCKYHAFSCYFVHI